VRYPDVVVDAVGGGDKDLVATAPVLIAEVISPSSATDDLGDKAAQYLSLANLAAYLVIAQDEPKAWVWVRGTAGFPPGPVVVGEDGLIEIPSLAVELPLIEVYGERKKR
jgi:Uma2 family endonuclease